MKPTVLFILCYIFIIGKGFSQTSKLVGQVAGEDQEVLANATVMLLQVKDSVLVKFALTNKEGRFEMNEVGFGNFLLRLTYLGYEQLDHPVEIKADSGPEYNIGQLTMQLQSKKLEEVVVKGERNPISLSKDTVVYNADAFRTEPNAVVEDLLKELPGIEVERDGTVRAQGEEVQKVYVDGKEFFGNDPQIATKNLPADAIDKVAVYDKKSELAEFSGVDDGVRQKTINLQLKEGKKKGVFGNARAGYGDMARFDSKVNINRFTPKNQFSLIGMANNVNEQGFSFKDYFQFMGGLQSLMSGGGGTMSLEITDGNELGLPLSFGNDNGFFTTYAGGFNFNNELSKKTEINGNYFYNRMDNEVSRTLNRLNFLEDFQFANTEQSLNQSLNNNHRFNVNLDHDIDSIQSIRFKTDFAFNDTKADLQSSSAVIGQDQLTENEGLRRTISNGEALNWNADLFYRRKFKKKGRLITTNLTFGIRENEANGQLNAINNFFNDGGLINISDTILQSNFQENNAVSWEARATLLEPIGEKKFLEFSYAHRNIDTEVDRKVFDQPNDENQEGIFNNQLSNRYESTYSYDRGSIGFRFNQKKFTFSTGTDLQHSKLNGVLLLSNTKISQSFLNLLPKLRFNYNFSNTNNLRFNYRTAVQEPSIQQLQPIEDNSDPLNIFIGNPNLKPEYRHVLDLNYLLFDRFSFTRIFTNLNYTYTENKIKYAQTINELFVRTNRPINVRNEHNFRSNISFGTPIRPLKIKFDVDLDYNFNRGITFINTLENNTERSTIAGGLRIDNRNDDLIEISLGARWSYTQTFYSISSHFDQDYFNQTYYTDLGLKLPKGIRLNSSLDYAIYRGRSNGFNDQIPIWNASISKFLLKGDQLQIRLSAKDLLNRNVGLTRNAELNYIEDIRINSLGRYFMLSMIYSIKGFGSGDGVVEINEERF